MEEAARRVEQLDGRDGPPDRRDSALPGPGASSTSLRPATIRRPSIPTALALLSTPRKLAKALGEALADSPSASHRVPGFGRPPSADPTIAVTFRLPRSLLARLDAARGDRVRGDVVREALERWLRAQRRKS